MGLIHRLRSKLETYRLQKRYTNRRKRRAANTYAPEAVYVNGEYIYTHPNHHGYRQPTAEEEEAADGISAAQAAAEAKANKRISSLIGCIGEETVRAERERVREKERERERKRRIAAATKGAAAAAAAAGTGVVVGVGCGGGGGPGRRMMKRVGIVGWGMR